MTNFDYWTRANRKTIIVRTDIHELPDGDLLRPKAEFLENPADTEIRKVIQSGRSLWKLRVMSKTGFDNEVSHFHLFTSFDSARQAQEKYPDGAEIDPLEFATPETKEFEIDSLSVITELSVLGRGEPPYSLIYDALHGAGIYENFKLSKGLLAWLGKGGIRALKERFGENWECIAIMEYCVRHFPSTSLAYMAARVMVADFISEDSFDGGYASRELEVLAGGVEDLANRSLEAQRRRGAGGGKASSEKRIERLNVFMSELEKLAPAVGLVSEDKLFRQAYENAKIKRSDMPDSTVSRERYEVEIRSSEPFRSRYVALFRKST